MANATNTLSKEFLNSINDGMKEYDQTHVEEFDDGYDEHGNMKKGTIKVRATRKHTKDGYEYRTVANDGYRRIKLDVIIRLYKTDTGWHVTYDNKDIWHGPYDNKDIPVKVESGILSDFYARKIGRIIREAQYDYAVARLGM